MTRLSDAQVMRAREMWAGDSSLEEIAAELGCSIYDLSPWLYQDETRELMADAMRRLAEQGGDA